MAENFKQRNLRLQSCGCRYRKHSNTKYKNDTLEVCEYLCQNHFYSYVLKLYNDELIKPQLRRIQ